MVVRKIQPAGDRRENRTQLDAVKRYTFVPLDEFHAGQCPHEIVVPERSAHFAVRDRLEPNTFLHRYDVEHRFVFDSLEFITRVKPIRTQRFRVMPLPGLVHGLGTQQAANVVGSKGCA